VILEDEVLKRKQQASKRDEGCFLNENRAFCLLWRRPGVSFGISLIFYRKYQTMKQDYSDESFGNPWRDAYILAIRRGGGKGWFYDENICSPSQLAQNNNMTGPEMPFSKVFEIARLFLLLCGCSGKKKMKPLPQFVV
jgi:hypothetical protein